jgi:hypothetical protein
MATKTVDVTLATMHNAGVTGVSPTGVIQCRTVHAVHDEQVFQSETLYRKLQHGQPMHPSGVTGIPPGQSLTYNVTKRLTLSHFGHEATGNNQMLIFSRDLTQRLVVSGQVREEIYQGSFNRKVRFDEIDGFNTISCDYNVIHDGGIHSKLIVAYTVNLVSSSG